MVECIESDTDPFCGAKKKPAESCGNGLELAQRLNIAIDVAQGITYLHEYKGTKPIQYMFFRSYCCVIVATHGQTE